MMKQVSTIPGPIVDGKPSEIPKDWRTVPPGGVVVVNPNSDSPRNYRRVKDMPAGHDLLLSEENPMVDPIAYDAEADDD